MEFDSKRDFALLPSCWGFSFALGHGVSFFLVISNILLNGSIRILQSLRPPWVMQAGMGRGSLLLQGLGPARGSHREGPGALQKQPSVSSGHPQLTCQPKARGPGGPVEQVTICLSPHSPLQGPHKHTHTHIPILTSIRKNSSHPPKTLLMDPVGKQDCPKSAPHLSLPAKSLSSGKRGQCWCLSHRLGLEKEEGLSFPGHLSEPSFLCPILRAPMSITMAPIFSPAASSGLEALSQFSALICEIQTGKRPLTSPCCGKRVLVFPHMTP